MQWKHTQNSERLWKGDSVLHPDQDTTTLRHQATESKAIKFFLVLVPHVEWLSYQLADETSHYILFSRISLLSEPSYKINALENEKGDEGMKRGDEKGWW